MKIFTNVVVPVLAVVTPLLVGYLTWSIDQAQTRISREIAALDGQIKRQEQSRKERESIQAYNMQVLEEVKTALKRDDEVYQKVVIGLLSSMPNKELAQAWLGALAQSEFTSIENREKVAQLRKVIEFEQIEDQIQNRYQPDRQAYNWEDYDYDIFWCEGSDAENKNLAAQMVGEMRAQGAKGRLRVRNLPLNVNARPGYGIKGYEIRRNYNEVAQATALMKLGNEILSNRGQFEIGLSAQDTRFYLSAFLCP